ncbi:MAG: hypothetical protein ACPGSI_18470, partial [Pikeienuella sp.]
SQERASAEATALQREIYEDTSGKLEGFRVAGDTALNRLLPLLGLAEKGPDFQPLSMSESSRFALNEGRDAIEAGAAGRGGLFSGATAQGLEDHRSRVAVTDRDNQLNRLFSIVQTGQNAASGQGAAGTQFAQSAGNNIIRAGDARAAGTIGGVNAVNDAIGNYVGYQNFNRLLDLAA